MHTRSELCNSQRDFVQVKKLLKRVPELFVTHNNNAANCLLLLSQSVLVKYHTENILLLAPPKDAHFTWVMNQES